MTLRCSLAVCLGLAASAVAMGANDALTGTKYTSPLGYTITLPPDWKVTSETGAESFFSKTGADESLGASVGRRDASTDLMGPEVLKMIDLSDVKVKKDRKAGRHGVPARKIQATATSEGESLVVRALAIKPSGKSMVYMLQIWGPVMVMAEAQIKADAKRLFGSFAPVAAK